MQRRHLALPVAAALALSLSACGKDADDTSSTYRSDPVLTARGTETMSSAIGETPRSPAPISPSVSDTSPVIPRSAASRPEKKEQPFGQGSPQTSMKGAEIPTVAPPSNENRAEGTSYDRGG